MESAKENNFKMPENLKGLHIHFAGIKGTGMTALVEIMFHSGAIITGSDVEERFYTDEILEKLGIKPLRFDEKNVKDDVDFVIYSSAYSLDKNPDLIAAVRKNIPCVSYNRALGQYSAFFHSCGICGVHGKTSTTGIAGTILKELDLPVQILAGSQIQSFGDSCVYASEKFIENRKKNQGEAVFVAETCEYQRHFMEFCPKNIILTSVESDHEDYYPTFEDIRNAFVDYICKLPAGGNLIYCADDKGAAQTVQIAKNEKKRADLNYVPYGNSCEPSCDFGVTFGEVRDGFQRFSVNYFSKNGCEDFLLAVPGKHEVLDAVAAIALCCKILEYFGKNPLAYYEKIANGVKKFTGGKRRSEIVKRIKINKNDVIIIDDYGHHPTAVKTTLQGYKKFYKNRKIILDFMSHTYSRTQSLLNEFSQCFDDADEIILHKIYSSARENPKDFKIDGKTLFEKTKENYKNSKPIFYFEEPLDAKNFALQELSKPLPKEFEGYLFVTMGAGDNWKLGREIKET